MDSNIVLEHELVVLRSGKNQQPSSEKSPSSAQTSQHKKSIEARLDLPNEKASAAKDLASKVDQVQAKNKPSTLHEKRFSIGKVSSPCNKSDQKAEAISNLKRGYSAKELTTGSASQEFKTGKKCSPCNKSDPKEGTSTQKRASSAKDLTTNQARHDNKTAMSKSPTPITRAPSPKRGNSSKELTSSSYQKMTVAQMSKRANSVLPRRSEANADSSNSSAKAQAPRRASSAQCRRPDNGSFLSSNFSPIKEPENMRTHRRGTSSRGSVVGTVQEPDNPRPPRCFTSPRGSIVSPTQKQLSRRESVCTVANDSSTISQRSSFCQTRGKAEPTQMEIAKDCASGTLYKVYPQTAPGVSRLISKATENRIRQRLTSADVYDKVYPQRENCIRSRRSTLADLESLSSEDSLVKNKCHVEYSVPSHVSRRLQKIDDTQKAMQPDDCIIQKLSADLSKEELLEIAHKYKAYCEKLRKNAMNQSIEDLKEYERMYDQILQEKKQESEDKDVWKKKCTDLLAFVLDGQKDSFDLEHLAGLSAEQVMNLLNTSGTQEVELQESKRLLEVEQKRAEDAEARFKQQETELTLLQKLFHQSDIDKNNFLTKTNDLEKKLKEAEDNLKAGADKTILSQTKSALVLKNKELEKKLQESDENLQDQIKMLHQADSEKNELLAKLNDLEKRLAEAEGSHEAQNDQKLQHAEIQSEHYLQKINDLEETLKNALADSERFRTEKLQHAEIQSEHYLQKINDLEENLKNALADSERHRTETLKQAETENKHYLEKISELEEKLKIALAHSETHRTELKEAESDKAALQAKLQDLEDKIEDAKGDYEAHIDEVVGEYVTKLKAAENNANCLSEQCKALELELIQSQDDKAKSQAEFLQEIQRLNEETMYLSEQIQQHLETASEELLRSRKPSSHFSVQYLDMESERAQSNFSSKTPSAVEGDWKTGVKHHRESTYKAVTSQEQMLQDLDEANLADVYKALTTIGVTDYHLCLDLSEELWSVLETKFDILKARCIRAKTIIQRGCSQLLDEYLNKLKAAESDIWFLSERCKNLETELARSKDGKVKKDLIDTPSTSQSLLSSDEMTLTQQRKDNAEAEHVMKSFVNGEEIVLLQASSSEAREEWSRPTRPPDADRGGMGLGMPLGSPVFPRGVRVTVNTNLLAGASGCTPQGNNSAGASPSKSATDTKASNNV